MAGHPEVASVAGLPGTAEDAALLAEGYQLAQFTPGEQACIAAKMREMKGEDRPQDQKIAIAISHCAPGKAKKDAAAPGSLAAESVAIPLPRRYSADKNADGTWNVRGVPIAAEIRRGDDDERSLAWLTRDFLEAAVAAARRRFERDGYMPPLHVQHHFKGQPVAPAGQFLPTRTAVHLYEGHPRLFVFADLLRIPAARFEEIRRGRLPYRSIEVLNPAKREIDSLALGDHWVPFFRMPLLGDLETKGPAAVHAAARAQAPLYAFSARGAGRAASFWLGGLDMGEETKTTEATAAKAEALADDGLDSARAKLAEGLEMAKAKVASLVEALDKIATEFGVSGSAAPAEEEAAPDMAPAEQPEMPQAHMQAGAAAGREAALLSRVATLERRLKEGEARASKAALLDASERSMRRYGLLRADLEKRFDQLGAAGLKAFVAAVQEVGVPIDDTVDDALPPAGATAPASEEKEVTAYQAQGPGVYATARALAAEWRGSTMLRGSFSLPKYLEINVAAETEGR